MGQTRNHLFQFSLRSRCTAMLAGFQLGDAVLSISLPAPVGRPQ